VGGQKSKRSSKTARPAGPPRRRSPVIWIVVVAAGAIIGGWALLPSSSTQTTPAATVRSLRVNVLRKFSHEQSAYTQGLVWHQGRLYESTGQYGSSTLRRVNPQTGEVEKRIVIPSEFFGEGLALVDRRLIMLTWKEETAFVHDLDSFNRIGSYRYTGEGWGLAFDGRRLIMSNGSDQLTFRDPQTFDPRGALRVTLRGSPLDRLNELEWAEGAIYANIWERDFIVRIDPEAGRVTHQIDAAGLLTRAEAPGAEVLNGIAYNPETRTFYITGKYWPTMYEVTFVE
jgi:glutaminyl-peptide cyclotransferase